MATGFRTLLTKSNRRPKKLWVDKGRKFYNNFKDVFGRGKTKVRVYSQRSLCERCNRTIKSKLRRQFRAQGNMKYLAVLKIEGL